MLLGHNHKKQDLKEAIRLAKLCIWPSAIWLTDLCNRYGCSQGPATRKEAKAMFNTEKDNALAITLAGMIDDDGDGNGLDFELIRHAATLGESYAQAYMFMNVPFANNELFYWVEQSAMQDDPQGLYWLGRCYRDPIGISQDKQKGMDCYIRAATLGHAESQLRYGLSLLDDDPKRYLWVSKYNIATGDDYYFLDSMCAHIQTYHKKYLRTSLSPVIFQMGKSLVGQVGINNKHVFGHERPTYYDDACLALTMYNNWSSLTKDAVAAWTTIATKKGFSKDIRRLIGNVIWASKSDGIYELDRNGSLMK